MAVSRFKKGERIYAAGFLTGVVLTGFVRLGAKGRDEIMVEFDMTRHRMWFPLERITKDYDL